MKKNWLKKSNKGFSLVELIVVIAVMAILVGVAVPVYSSYIEKAQIAKDKQLVNDIKYAMEIASVGEKWSSEYNITQDGTYIGAIVLSPPADVVVQQEAVVGTAIHDAMVLTFGTDYAKKLKLSYDGWEGSLGSANLNAIVGSSYYGNVPTLMGNIQSLSNALGTFFDLDFVDYKLSGPFGEWCEMNVPGSVGTVDGNRVAINGQAIANAAILYASTDMKNINKEKFLEDWADPQKDMLAVGTELTSAAASYAKLQAAVNWYGCSGLKQALVDATAGLQGAIAGITPPADDEEDTALVDLFGALYSISSHIYTDEDNYCEHCWPKMSNVDTRSFYYAYVADTATCLNDANAYIALLEQVGKSSDKVLENINDDNIFEDPSLVAYVNNYVNVAEVLKNTYAADDSIVFTFSLDADGALKTGVYPLDYME